MNEPVNKPSISPKGADADTFQYGVGTTHKVAFFRNERVRVAAAALLLVVVCASVSALVALQFQRETVVFDMKGTIDTFIQQSAKTPLDENAARALTTRFNQALNASLGEWVMTHDALILVPGAVVMPTKNITPQIQTDIARRMQEAQ
ncbi:TrbI F-type domain-containing protein [Acerihabitans sp. TG2]|uniref:TrbI F-type domain-containing protein n=1 Tax=Acerihabitans sp. TG2 TaxID=3096008 RepID=UPI002B23D908|nr:TrbI F-type domain-containing protein [Acerihabitans sp. TG2]MEA9392696.1 TrbI F-type domain-containing protein [Acerihabitans sp. TG2]